MKNQKEKMEGILINLSKEKSEELFHNSLCNGLQQLSYYGIQFDYKQKDYESAKKSLQYKVQVLGVYPKEMFVMEGKIPEICFEDVLMEILRNGGELKVSDVEGEGEYNRSITLKDVHERVCKTQFNHLNDAIEENDDAITADVILQTVFFEEIIFG